MGFIIVGLDNSQASRLAFHEAIRQAGWRDAKVVALHTIALPTMTEYGTANFIQEALEANRTAAKAELDQLESGYDGGFPVDVELRTPTGHAGIEIIRASEGSDSGEADEQGPAELVIIGSRGLGGFKGLLLGSVSTYAVHHVKCPLLIIPTTDES